MSSLADLGASASEARLAHLFRQGGHVPHAEDPAREAVGVEGLQALRPLGNPGEVDGLARDPPRGEGGPAPGVPVQLGEDEARDPHPLVKGLGHGEGLLARHGVQDEEDLVGAQRRLEAHELLHEALVNLEAAGGVHQDEVPHLQAGPLLHPPPDGLGAFPVLDLEDRHPHLLPQDAELLPRRRALGVRRHQEGTPPLPLVVEGELGGGGGLPRPLEPHEEPDVPVLELGVLGLPAQGLLQGLVDRGQDHLGRGQALQDLPPQSPLPHLLHEGPGHLQVHVGLNEGAADLPEGSPSGPPP